MIYQPEMLAARGYALFYELNPFYYLIEIVRTPMQGKPLPEGKMYLIAVTLAFVVFFTSIFAVMRQKSKIAMKL